MIDSREIVVCGVPFETALEKEALHRLKENGVTSVQIYTFWKDFEPALKTVSQLAEQKALARQTAKPTGQQCPRCGKPLVERKAKTGPFVGCSGYPACRFSTSVGRYIPQPKQAKAG